MRLEDYTSTDGFWIKADSVRVASFEKDCNVNVEIFGLCWEDIVAEVAGCDDDFVEAFISRIREVQKSE